MNVKTGTTTWGKNQASSFEKDTTKNVSAFDAEKALGGEQEIGDLLNKVADPNWVDPTKVRQVGNNTLDKDAFLKLMLAQMKHQDPTNPQPSHEMAAQLAQFTSLEQLNNINSSLGDLKNAQQPQLNYQALNFIGKKVSGDSSKLLRIENDTKHDFNFNLSGDSAKVSVKVLDSDGVAVRTIEHRNLSKGPNTITWNGMNDDGSAARAGEYRFLVEATSSNGGKVFAKTDFDGKITGLNYTPQGPVLLVGNQTIKMSDVKRIEELGSEQPVQNIPLESGANQSGGMGLPLKTSEPEEVGKAEDPVVKSNIKKTIAMSGPVMDQVKKAQAGKL